MLPGHRVRSVEVLDQKVVRDGPEVVARSVGRRVRAIERRGKILGVSFDRPGSLLIHPKMTGQLVVTAKGQTVFAGGHPSPAMLGPMPHATTRAVFALDRGMALYFNDGRRFGWIRPSGAEPFTEDPDVARLGPDPTGSGFPPSVLRRALERHAGARIKAVLLDQTVVAGIGNIYADESLSRARIHPARRAGDLTAEEAARLHASIRAVLRAAIATNGTSFAGPVNEFRGSRGYLGRARVFRREGMPCRRCGATILKTTVAGRTTRYCPVCQPLTPPG